MNESWNDVAFKKLARVLGASQARAVMAVALAEMAKDGLESADDLYRFARTLIKKGGFVGAVGGLLSVHAALHGATERPSDAA